MLVEVLVALALFMVLIATTAPFYIGVLKDSVRDQDEFQAGLYAEEAIEAVRSIRDRDFAELVNGTYGLTRAPGYWRFSGNSESVGKFTRTITVTDAARDASCNLVASGTPDTYTKIITVTLSWNDGLARQYSSTHYLTNWRNSIGCEQSGNLYVNLSSAVLSSGGQRIINITLTNLGSTAITIDKVRPVWSNSRLIEEVKIGSTIVWKYNSTGSPSGLQPSGTILDIDNVVLQPNSGSVILDHFFFDGNMSGASFTLYFTMADGSIRYGQINVLN